VGALGEVVAVVRPSAPAQAQVQGRGYTQKRPAPIAMDRGQMQQVLVNVVKNALEAIGNSGTITVRVGRHNGRASIAVEDTGPGLTPAAREQLFTPFFTTKEQGQGIGLTLVQQILAQHRFEYALESPPGGPTKFSIVM